MTNTLSAFDNDRACADFATRSPRLAAWFKRKAEYEGVSIATRSVQQLDALMTNSHEQALARMTSLEALVDGFTAYLDERAEALEAAQHSDDPSVRYSARVYGRLPDDWKDE